ncbi:MAG TPA: hypothetical protein VHA75_08050 [Rugosimonospora sp.]|nr:hypothetical protein [Rugosimonospora sp.]
MDGEQPDLLDLLNDHRPLAVKFREFHGKHPEVYELLVALARQWVERMPGRRCGIQNLLEVARWQYTLRTGTAPALNNSFAAFYSRLIMAQNPDLAGLFETRRSVADQASGEAA